MLIQGQEAYRQQVRGLVATGLAVGLVLALAFALMLGVDRNARMHLAQRQAMIQADAAQRLLQARVVSYGRAMGAVRLHLSQLQDAAGDGGLRSDLLEDSLRAATERNPGLVEMSIVDDGGRLLAGARGDPDFYDWAVEKHRGQGGGLVLGPLQARGENDWRLPLAQELDAGRWLLARLEGADLQKMMESTALGAGGVQVLVDPQGLVLADSRGDRLLGRLLPGGLPPAAGRVPAGLFGDGVDRIVAVAPVAGLPLSVVVGRASDEALTGWWRYLAAALLVLLVYGAGMAYLLQVVRAGYRRQQQLGEELRAGSAELARANQIGRVSTWTANEETIHWGAGAAALYGVEPTSARLEDFFARVHHEDAGLLRKAWQHSRQTGAPLDVVFRLVLPGGRIRWISARGERMERDTHCLTGAAVDVTERLEAQERAREAERQFRLLFDRNPVPIWLFDMHTLRFLEVNQAAIRQYGYSREEFLAMNVLDIRPREEWAEVQESVSLALKGIIREARVRTHLRKDGTQLSVMAQTAQIDFDGHHACLVLAVDVTERLAYERDLAYRASHHPETGLLTRRALAETLDLRGRPYAIAHIQLRGLQMVAHTLGQAIGDQVLRTVAARLGGLGSRYGLLAYQPGEDFILAVKGRFDLEQVIEHLCEVVAEPVRGPESFHQLQAHIGVDVCRDGRTPADQVLAHAAQAAWAAREAGDLVRHYDDAVASRLTARLHLASRIHTAIEQGEFELYFQPICEAASGRPLVFEALLRWPQADGSWIAPGEFIGLAEDTGQMIALGRWVIRAAARAQRLLAQAGWPQMVVAVNVSAVQFFNDDLVGEISRACEDMDIPPSCLQVELTESSLMRDPERGRLTMQRLHERGICVALDDFGTGFSSMSYLQHLSLDVLKIDRSFLQGLEHDPRNAAICQALLSLGHSLGLKVVAEGVETEGQRQWMVEHGCDHLQGFLLGRPVSLQDTLRWLEAHGSAG